MSRFAKVGRRGEASYAERIIDQQPKIAQFETAATLRDRSTAKVTVRKRKRRWSESNGFRLNAGSRKPKAVFPFFRERFGLHAFSRFGYKSAPFDTHVFLPSFSEFPFCGLNRQLSGRLLSPVAWA